MPASRRVCADGGRTEECLAQQHRQTVAFLFIVAFPHAGLCEASNLTSLADARVRAFENCEGGRYECASLNDGRCEGEL